MGEENVSDVYVFTNQEHLHSRNSRAMTEAVNRTTDVTHCVSLSDSRVLILLYMCFFVFLCSVLSGSLSLGRLSVTDMKVDK